MPSINDVIYKSTLPKYVELFDIDCRTIPSINGVFRVTANIEMTPTPTEVMFNGQKYLPFPIKLEGIAQKSEGAYSRPTLSISNVGNIIGGVIMDHEDIVGAKIYYYRTFDIYLQSNTAISAPPMVFFIGKKISHSRTVISWELRHLLDKERTYLPGRQMLKRDFPGLGDNRHIS